MTIKIFLDTIYPVRHQLYRFAKRLLKNDMDAEDIVQETLVRLWERKEKLHEYRSAAAFAITITRNLCFDKIKSKGYRTNEVLENDIEQQELNPYMITKEKNTFQLINKLINNLPENQRMVIHLRDIEHYELNEISKLTGLTPNNVRVSLSRARKSIRKQLENKYDYAGSKN